jgi:hypothetical protein
MSGGSGDILLSIDYSLNPPEEDIVDTADEDDAL